MSNKRNEVSSFGDDMWDADDAMDMELAAQANLMESQALSQRIPPAEDNVGRRLKGESRGNIVVRKNVQTSLSSSLSVGNASPLQAQKRPLLGSTSGILEKKLCPQSTAYAYHLKTHTDASLTLELTKLRERIKTLEHEKNISEAKNKCLNEMHVADEQRIQNTLKTIQSLESQLAFKNHELTSVQWVQSQQSASTSKANRRPTTSFSVKPNSEDSSEQRSGFPTVASFYKPLPVAANVVPVNSNKSAVSADVCDQTRGVVNNAVLKLNIEKVDALFMKMLIRPIQCVSSGSEPPLVTLFSNRESEDNSTTFTSSETADDHSCKTAHLESVLFKFLSNGESSSSDVVNDILSCYTLKNDCGEVFLRLIEDRLALPQPKGDGFCLNVWHKCLYLLKHLINCSPSLRRCILNEKFEDDSLNWWKAQNVTSDEESSAVHSRCSALKTLFDVFTPAIQALIVETHYDKLSEDIFQVFINLAMNSKAESLQGFVPLFNLNFLKVCKSFLSKPRLLVCLTRFLSLVCDAPEIMQATCTEEMCFWVLLANGWQEATKMCSLEQLSTLDLRMCQLLSQCLSHEYHKPPFIIAPDCLCPFDVSFSLLQCLYRYQKQYESTGKIHNLNNLQRCVSVWYDLMERDPNIGDKRIRMKAEYYSVLGWLNRLHTKKNLGPTVEALLGKYFPGL